MVFECFENAVEAVVDMNDKLEGWAGFDDVRTLRGRTESAAPWSCSESCYRIERDLDLCVLLYGFLQVYSWLLTLQPIQDFDRSNMA